MKQFEFQICRLFGRSEFSRAVTVGVLAVLSFFGFSPLTFSQVVPTGVPLGPPYAILIKSRERDMELRVAQYEIMRRMLDESVITQRSPEELRKAIVSEGWQNPERTRRAFGTIYCVDSSGRDVMIFARSCAGQAQFEEEVSDSLRWPGELVVHRDGNYVTTDEATIIEQDENSRTETTRGAMYLGYENGVVLYGHSEVPNAPYGAIGDYMKSFAETDWGILIKPAAIPLSQRKANLKRFELETGTQIQGIDGELPSATRIRAARLSAYRDLVDLFWLDVDSVEWKVTEARPNQPYKARFEVVARPSSELATQFAELQGRQPPELVLEDALAELTASFRIPKNYRSVLLPLLEASAFAESATGAAVRDFLLQGDCRFQLGVTIDGDSLPILTGVVATPTVALPAETLAAPFLKRPGIADATFPWVIRNGNFRQPVVVNAEIDDSALRFSVAMNDQVARRPETTNRTSSKAESSQTLFRLRGDLRPLGKLDESHPIHSFVESLEHLLREVRPARSRPRVRFQSLSRYIGTGDSSSDWSFEISARLVGANRIVVEAHVGAELWVLWRCRELIDGHRLNP